MWVQFKKKNKCCHFCDFLLQNLFNFDDCYCTLGVEGAVRGLEGTHPADTCILTKL
jgi:hypothetical protein